MLNNMKAWLLNYPFSDSSVSTSSSGTNTYDLPYHFWGLNGEEYVSVSNTSSNVYRNCGFRRSCSFLLGKSNAITTDNMYSLVDDVTSNFTVTNIQTTEGLGADGLPRLIISANATNNSGDTITINEIGLKRGIHTKSAGYDSTFPVLLDRKSVLDGGFLPLTFAMGETKTICYAVEL